MTPDGIEPATFRFVAQHLNHCATAVPQDFETVRNTIPTALCKEEKKSKGKDDTLLNLHHVTKAHGGLKL